MTLKSLFGVKAARQPTAEEREAASEKFLWAAMEGKVEGMEREFGNGADINHQDNIGATALMKASEDGFDEGVAFLLEKKADVSLTNHFNQTALHLALRSGEGSAIALRLIEAGTPIDGRDRQGSTPAFYAAQTGKADALEILTAKGADFTVPSMHGTTPLMMCLHHPKAVAVLTKYDCGLNMQDNDGQTALMLATITRNLPLVEKFLAMGAHAHIKDNNGETAAAIARRLGIDGPVLERLEAAENAPAEAFRSGTEKGFSTMKKIVFAQPGAPA
jgi:ankyrin repeat protein